MGMIDAVVQDPEKRNPPAHFELNKEWAKELKKFKPGQVVKVLVTGTLSSQSFEQDEDPELRGFVGRFCVDATDLKIDLAKRNEIAELFADEYE